MVDRQHEAVGRAGKPPDQLPRNGSVILHAKGKEARSAWRACAGLQAASTCAKALDLASRLLTRVGIDCHYAAAQSTPGNGEPVLKVEGHIRSYP